MKKLSSLIFIFAVLFVLSGCQANDVVSTEEAAPVVTTEEAAAPVVTPETPVEETAEVTQEATEETATPTEGVVTTETPAVVQ